MERLSLIGQWTLAYQDQPAIPVCIPGSLYSGLLAQQQMQDPYWRENEYEATALSQEDCVFSRCFTVEKAQLDAHEAMLVFYGLDTIADIYLNGTFLGHTENMHRTFSYPVRSLLLAGENTLTVKIASPLAYIQKAYTKAPIYGVNPAECIPGYQHLRKAHSMFGWDWAPKLPDMGIFRPCEIQFITGGSIQDVFVRQTHTKDEVVLSIAVSNQLFDQDCTLALSLSYQGKELCAQTLCADDSNEVQFVVKDPQLWWPNGLGEQPLYELHTSLLREGTLLDESCLKIGLRTLTVSRTPDQWGEEFCLVVNGVKFFSMGGDYVPEDSILAYTNPARTKQLLQDCVAANFNTIRVWGGGYYPEDWFYEQCDQLGLVVWQDFMFACAAYLLTSKFKENVAVEIRQNILRLRNHPSLGLLCGNNEMEQEMLLYVNHNHRLKEDYIELYERVIAELCDELAPDTFYWPSSPSSGGGFDNPEDPTRGDVHYWAVWHANKPFEDYRNHYFRFCSEFGFESLPCFKTVESFSLPEDRNLLSAVMESHQKRQGCNSKILNYITQHYLCPTTLETMIYASQLIQADAMRYGVEHWRRHRGRCMGAIYWQLNDCWPVASWSSIDYFGRWKALHYYAKRFFAPTLLSFHINHTQCTVNLSHEQRTAFSGKITFAVKDNEFHVLYEKTCEIILAPFESRDVICQELAQYFATKQACRTRFITATLWDDAQNKLSQISETIEKYKHYQFAQPHFSMDITEQEDFFALHIQSDVYAKNVFLEGKALDLPFSDNYFDLVDAQGATLRVEKSRLSQPIEKEQLAAALQITSTYDIGREG